MYHLPLLKDLVTFFSFLQLIITIPILACDVKVFRFKYQWAAVHHIREDRLWPVVMVSKVLPNLCGAGLDVRGSVMTPVHDA